MKPQSSFYNTGNAWALTAKLTLWLGLVSSWTQWPCLKMDVQAGIEKMDCKGEGKGGAGKKGNEAFWESKSVHPFLSQRV